MARVYVVCRREDGWLALLAAGNTVMAAAMRQWQREAGGEPLPLPAYLRGEGELPQTNAAISAIKIGDGVSRGWAVKDIANLMEECRNTTSL
ncbi:MAG: hypothetical protein J0L63_06190 [Anaerolineae bacterium]|nr:hypothetical protein [Anaerolineae bacterium]